jgi:quinolinate synthase
MPFTPAPAELESAIRSLKKELDAVILAHYYQESEIQDLADFIGDSLALAQEAARTQAKVIVFCGVHFMAETAKILNPTRQVLLPDLAAGCSLADRTPPAAFAAFKAKHPGAFVVTYVNSSAEVKAMSDVICTSSNAVKMVEKAPKDRPIIFAPDQHLGRWVQKQTGRELILWPGSCIVHEIFSEKRLVQLKVDVGEPEPRTVLAGIAESYQPEQLVGRTIVVVANLKPAKLMGIESNGMVLAASPEGGGALLLNAEPAAPGTRVR